MLRRGSISFNLELILAIVIGATMFLGALWFGGAAFNILFDTGDQGLEQLALRTSFLAGGKGIEHIPIEQAPAKYGRTGFVLQGDDDEALLAFHTGGQVITTTSDGGSFSYENPCDGACMCVTEIGETSIPRRSCEVLTIENVRTVRMIDEDVLESYNLEEISGTTPETQLYPAIGSDQQYSDVYIEIKDGESRIRDDRERLPLYIEYMPSYTDRDSGNDVRQVLLITPLEEGMYDRLDRLERLDLCWDGSDEICKFRSPNSALPGGQMCKLQGSICVQEEAPECPYGIVPETCVCGSTTITSGLCINDQHFDTSACETITSCDDYCADGSCTEVQSSACALDVCQVRGNLLCGVDQGICKETSFDTQSVAEVAKGLLTRGPGYHYDIVPVSTQTTGFLIGINPSGRTLACANTEQNCQAQFESLAQGTCNDEQCKIAVASTPACNSGSCICHTGTGLSALVQNREFQSSAVDVCFPIGDAIIAGRDSRLRVMADGTLPEDGPIAGAYIDATSVKNSAYQFEESAVLLIEAYVPEDGNTPVVGVSLYDEYFEDKSLSERMGCDSRTCAPLPQE